MWSINVYNPAQDGLKFQRVYCYKYYVAVLAPLPRSYLNLMIPYSPPAPIAPIAPTTPTPPQNNKRKLTRRRRPIRGHPFRIENLVPEVFEPAVKPKRCGVCGSNTEWKTNGIMSCPNCYDDDGNCMLNTQWSPIQG